MLMKVPRFSNVEMTAKAMVLGRSKAAAHIRLAVGALKGFSGALKCRFVVHMARYIVRTAFARSSI